MQNYIGEGVNEEKYIQTSIPFIIYLNRRSFLSQISSSSMELPFALIQKTSPIYAALKGKIGRTPGF